MCNVMLSVLKVLKNIKIRFVSFAIEIQSFANNKG